MMTMVESGAAQLDRDECASICPRADLNTDSERASLRRDLHEGGDSTNDNSVGKLDRRIYRARLPPASRVRQSQAK